MLIISIINSIAIVFLFYKLEIIKITVYREETFWNKTLMCYNIYIHGHHFRIPVRNKYKTELNEEINRMISLYDHQGKLQRLTAIFSWLKTLDEVKKFEKEYSVVDRKIVEKLVLNFNIKNKKVSICKTCQEPTNNNRGSGYCYICDPGILD